MHKRWKLIQERRDLIQERWGRLTERIKEGAQDERNPLHQIVTRYFCKKVISPHTLNPFDKR
jgi:hypothetical protein